VHKDYLAFLISLFLSRLTDQILLFIVPLVVADHQQRFMGRARFSSNRCDKYPPVRILHISQVYRALLCVLAIAWCRPVTACVCVRNGPRLCTKSGCAR